MKKIVSNFLHWLKYAIAAFMMYAGIATMFIAPVKGSELGIIYENRPALALFGTLFFISGLTLFIGKVTKMNRVTGYGLFMIYACFTFSFLLNWIALSFHDAYGNLIAALMVGALYLRWKYHIFYYEPCLDRVHATMLDSEPLDE